MIKFFWVSLFTIAISILGCGGDDTSSTSTTTYHGTVAFDDGNSGVVEITFPDQSSKLSVRAQGSGSQNITGQCIYPDGAVDLAGSYNTSTGDFTLTGGGYTFTGNYDSTTGAFTGSVTNDSGASGSFSGVDGDENDVQIFCGTFDDTQGGGVLLLVVDDSTATGSYSDGSQTKSLVGIRGSSGNVEVAVVGETPVEGNNGAFGTISGNTLNGMLYQDGVQDGTFTTSTEDCP